MLSIFQPDDEFGKGLFHGVFGIFGFGRSVEEERAILSIFFAGVDPREAILIGLVDLQGHVISFDDLCDQFDGVPPLACAFCGERDPFHLEVGLHLLVTLDVLQCFYGDQHSGEFALDACDVLNLVRVDLFAEDVVH